MVRRWGHPTTLKELYGRDVTKEDRDEILRVFMLRPGCNYFENKVMPEDLAKEVIDNIWFMCKTICSLTIDFMHQFDKCLYFLLVVLEVKQKYPAVDVVLIVPTTFIILRSAKLNFPSLRHASREHSKTDMFTCDQIARIDRWLIYINLQTTNFIPRKQRLT